MKKKSHVRSLIPGLLIISLLLAAAISCDTGPQTGTGHLTFKLYLEGYPYSGSLQAEVEVDGLPGSESSRRTAAFGDDFSAYTYFPNLEAGVWDIRIRYIDGEDMLGETYELSVASRIDRTVVTTVTGRYADGEIVFSSVTDSLELRTSMEIDKLDALITATSQGSSGNANVESNIYLFGDFYAAQSVTTEYPDGLVSTMHRKSLAGDITYITVMRDMVMAGRPLNIDGAVTLIDEQGTYRVTVEDENGALIQQSDDIVISIVPEFLPAITFPTDGTNQNTDAGDWNINWTNGNSAEVENIGVVIFDQSDSKTPLFTQIVYDPQGTQTVLVPDAALTNGSNYTIIVAAFDRGISDELLTSLNGYSSNEFIPNLVRIVEEDLNAVAFHMITFVGSP